MELIVLYGPPGVGKLTVANEIAAINGYKVFHNHLTVDLVHSVFEFGTPDFNRLSTKFRLEMFEEAAKANVAGLIFTLVYAAGSDDGFIQQIIDGLKPYDAQIKFVLLTCKTETLLHRAKNESRLRYGKLRNPEFIKEFMRQEEFCRPIPHAPSLIIDNTDVSPTDAASEIIDWSPTR